jgi:hypothetical protein
MEVRISLSAFGGAEFECVGLTEKTLRGFWKSALIRSVAPSAPHPEGAKMSLFKFCDIA